MCIRDRCPSSFLVTTLIFVQQLMWTSDVWWLRFTTVNLCLFRWIRRWFEVEDRVLYCYDAQEQHGSKVKRAAVLYQASVKVKVPAQAVPYRVCVLVLAASQGIIMAHVKALAP